MLATSAALLLTALAGGTYWILDREFHVNENRRLDDTVRLLQTVFKNNDRLVETLRREIPADLEAFRFNRYQLHIEDDRGQVLYETMLFPKLTPAQVAEVPSYQEGDLGDGQEIESGDLSYLVLQTWAIRERGSRQKVRLLVAYDNTQARNVMSTYSRFLVAMVGFGVLLALLLARGLVRQALRPLTRMTRMVQRLKVDRLSERFSARPWPLELEPLALEFDRLLEEVERGLARLSHFSTDLAHELRTPLTSMMLQAEVGLSQPRTPEQYQEILSSSVEEMERLTGLVERLLLLARTEAAREQLSPEWLAVREMAERLVEYHLGHLEAGDVAVNIPETARLHADPRLVEMALGNLLSNAAKYGHPPLRLEWAEYPNELVISLQDSGPGISNSDLPFLFDRLYRADTSRHHDGSSHGLGLALVRSALQAHGGEVRVYSEVGRGSRFGLYFPLNPSGPDEERSSTPPAAPE